MVVTAGAGRLGVAKHPAGKSALNALAMNTKARGHKTAGFVLWDGRFAQAMWARTASSSKATMLVILIAGFTAGPAVSL